MPTGISYVDETWNPVQGCSPVSPGCLSCYAQGIAHRFKWGLTDDRGKWTGEVKLIESALDKPKSWRKPRRVLVPSMGDLFAEAVPDEFVARVFAKMANVKRHTFLLLTKRPERLLAWLPNVITGPIPNIVLGCTVEDQERAEERLTVLTKIWGGGWRTWISAEPLLSRIGIAPFRKSGWQGPALEFVAVGGETGPGARPCKTDWIRSVVGQCQAHDVRCHVKQLGKGAAFNPEDWPRDLPKHA